MKKLFKCLALTVLVGIGLSLLPGCRTAHGFGEDIENAGKGIQHGTD